jgi:hypothetical protein
MMQALRGARPTGGTSRAAGSVSFGREPDRRGDLISLNAGRRELAVIRQGQGSLG